MVFLFDRKILAKITRSPLRRAAKEKNPSLDTPVLVHVEKKRNSYIQML